MDKKLFLYELKGMGKVPIISLAAYAVAWIVCGAFWFFGFLSLEAIDHISIPLLYAIFAYVVVVAVYRTAAYNKLYEKVNRAPDAVIGARMLVLAIILVASTLLLLLGGTLMDVIARNTRPGEYPIYRYSARMFTCYRRSPLQWFFPLSVALCGLVFYSAATVVVNAVISVHHPVAKIAAGLVSTAIMFFFVMSGWSLAGMLPDAPAWGMGDPFSYPMPFDRFSYEAYIRPFYDGDSGTNLAFRFYACWNICNIVTLFAGCALVFFSFPANAIFRMRTRSEYVSVRKSEKKNGERRTEN